MKNLLSTSSSYF